MSKEAGWNQHHDLILEQFTWTNHTFRRCWRRSSGSPCTEATALDVIIPGADGTDSRPAGGDIGTPVVEDPYACGRGYHRMNLGSIPADISQRICTITNAKKHLYLYHWHRPHHHLLVCYRCTSTAWVVATAAC